VENLPVFIGINAAAAHLGCYPYQVEKKIGSADVLIRRGVRDDKAWLKARVDRLIDFAESPAGTLWTRVEAQRRLQLTRKITMRLLDQPVGWLENQYATFRLPLFAEKQLDLIREKIASREIKLQPRNLTGPIRGACIVDARHVLSELGIEEARIRAKRKQAEFWANIL
jgi:hypothetical protein